jgi:Protein of unknown function (DUF1573)
MKTRSILMGLLLVTLSAWSQEQPLAVKEYAIVSWDKTFFDFGVIEQNKPVRVVFKLKNIGSIPVEVLGVSRGSGCSALEYPIKPVLPGETGIVEVEFDAKTIGYVSKIVRIKLNTKTPETELYYTGMVKGVTIN